MTTNLCRESTGRRADESGYDVTFPSDAIGAENMVAYEASVRANHPLVANAVMKVKEFVAALTAAPHGGRAAVGDTVTGSDRGSIGTVPAVLADAEVPHMQVSSGVLGLGDKLYIPLEAVVQRAGSEVFVNIPKLVAAKMPWHEPPTAQTQRDTQGPPLAGVARMYGSVETMGDRSAAARLD